jgi:hypothetical protein
MEGLHTTKNTASVTVALVTGSFISIRDTTIFGKKWSLLLFLLQKFESDFSVRN